MHKKHGRKAGISYSPRGWKFIGLTGGFILVLGVVTLCEGRLSYHNYWGGSVFAPFAIVIGLLCMYVAYAKLMNRKGT
jgi:hypothetical protein